MKLHLPKMLRNSVLACITAVAGIATTVGTAAITGGVVTFAMSQQQAAAATPTIADGVATFAGASNENIQTTDIGEAKKIIFNMEDSGTANWFGAFNKFAADVAVQIGDGSEGQGGLYINNGNSGYYAVFRGALSGTGTISKKGAGTGNTIQFHGDTTAYNGNVELQSTENFTLIIGGDYDSTTATAGTTSATSGVFGSGSITSTAAASRTSTVKIAHAASETPVYVTNAYTAKGEGSDYLIVEGGADYIFTKDCVAENFSLNAGSATFQSALTLNGTVALRSAITAQGAVTLGENVVFDLTNLTATDGVYSIISGGTLTGCDNLTAANITGVETVGKSWTFNNDGTITYIVTSKDLTWAGGALDWNATGTNFTTGGEFANDDSVTFTGSADVTVAEGGVSVITLNITGKGTVVSLVNAHPVTVVQGTTIGNGATLSIEEKSNTVGVLRGDVTVQAGGTLRFTKGDVTGFYGGANSTKIDIQAGGTLYLAHDTNETYANTLYLAGTMKGDAGSMWDMFRPGDSNNNEDNAAIVVRDNQHGVVDGVKLRLRKDNTKIFVGQNASLTTGEIYHHEGNGTLVKAGSGTLLHKNAEGKPGCSIRIAGGVYEFYVGDDDSYTGAGLTGEGVLVKSGSGELQLEKTITASAVNITDGSILVKSNGVLDLTAGKNTGTSNGQININGDSTLKNLLEQMANITTEGTGYVKIAGNTGGNAGDVSMTADMKLSSSNLRVNGALVLHGRAWDNNHINGHILSVEDGASLFIGTAENALSDLEIKSKATVNVTGSSILTAGLVKLGYEADRDADFYGVLSLDDATATVSGVQFRHNYAGNSFAASNSTIQFTGENIISTVGDTVTGAFRITDSTWNVTTNQSLTQSNGIAVELGGVTVDVAAEKKLTLGGELTMSGALTKTGDGTLEFASGAKLMLTTAVMKTLETTSTEVAAGQNGLASSVSYTLLSGSVTGTPTVTLDGSAEGFTYADGKIIVAGENVFMVGDTYSTADAAASDDAKGSTRFHVSDTGEFTLAGNVDDKKHTLNNLMTTTSGTGTIVLSGSALVSGETGTVFQGDVEIVSGGTLNLGREGNTGVTSATKADIDSLGKIILNGGTLFVRGAACNVGDIVVKGSSSTFNCYDMNAKTDTIVADSLDLQANLTLSAVWKSTLNVKNLTGSGKLEVSGRNAQCGVNDVFTMNIEDMSEFTGSFDIKGADKSTIINANLSSGKILNASQVVLAGEKTAFNLSGAGTYNLGNTLAMTTGVSLAEGWTGTVTAADVSVTGEMDASTLANAASKLNINGLTVADGAALTLGGKVTLDGAVTVAESIANAGALTFGSTLQLDLTGMTSAIGENGTSVITLLTGAGTSNLASLTDAMLTTATKEMGSNWTFNSDGTISFTAAAGAAGDLFWEGTGATGNWSSTSWSTEDGVTTNLGGFTDNANVTFSGATEATTITVDTNATVGSMTVSGAAYTFNRTESNTITASSLVIGENASATFGAGALDLAALESLSIAAGGVLDLTAMNGATVFNETTNMAEGAGTIKLTAGSRWMLTGGSEAEPKHFSVDVNYVFSGNTTMNSGNYTHSVLDIKGDMDIDGVFLLENRITADVMGGNLKATEIKLGHAVVGNAGHLKMSAGTITAGAITVSNADTTTNTFTMEGGTLELTGTAGIAATIDTQITGGKLKTGDNSWSITGAEIGGSTAGAVSIETGTGTITLNNVNLTSALTNKGKLALSGTINIVDTAKSAWNPEEVAGTTIFRDGAGTEGDNGFRHTSKDYTILTSTSTGTTNVTGVTWQLNGAAIDSASSFANGVLNVVAAADADKAFWVNSGTVNYGSIGTEGQEGYVAATNTTGAATLKLSGGTLALNKALVGETTITVNAASTIQMAAGVTLSKTSITGQTATNKVTMQGADATAVFNMGSDVNVTGLDFTSPDWKGTVKLTNVISNTKLNISTTLNSLANANSSVTVTNVKGYFDTANALTANLVLVNAADGTSAISITNGNADDSPGTRKAVISGSVSGDGDIAFSTWSGINSKYATYEFTGEISGWTGSFVNKGIEQYSGYANVIIAGDTEINASVVNDADRYTGSKLYLTIGGESDVVMNGAVNVDKLTVNQNTSFTNTVAATDMVIAAAASVTNDLSLTTLNNTGSLTATDKSITVTGAVTGTGSIIAGALTLQGAENTVGALTLSGDLTLGTDSVASSLTAGALSIGGNVNLNRLSGSALITSTTGLAVDSTLKLVINHDELLRYMTDAQATTVDLAKIEGLDLNKVTLNGSANRWTDADGQYLYTLNISDAGVLSLQRTVEGLEWIGTDTTRQWDEGANWMGGVAPDADASVKFTADGAENVMIPDAADGTDEIAIGNITIEGSPTGGYNFIAATNAKKPQLRVVKNLSVNGGTLNLNVNMMINGRSEIEKGATVNVKSGIQMGSQHGFENNGTLTITKALFQVTNGNMINTGSVTNDGNLQVGTGAQVTESSPDLVNSGTLTNKHYASVEGDLVNSGVYVQDVTGTEFAQNEAASLLVMGNLTNTGTAITTDADGITIKDGSVQVNGLLTNSDSISVSGGQLVAGQVPLYDDDTNDIKVIDNDGGTITVTGGSVTAHGHMDNAGTLTIGGEKDGDAYAASMKVNGDLDNTGGTISVGTADAEGNPESYGKLEVTGNLTGTGSADKLKVEQDSILIVGGDLVATDIDLGFNGNVTVGGDATATDLTIAEEASFTAANATITGTLHNDGTFTTTSTDTNNKVIIGSLSGSGVLEVAGGTLYIENNTEFDGTLTGSGELVIGSYDNTTGNVTYQGIKLETQQNAETEVVASSVTIATQADAAGNIVSANGSTLGAVTTDSIVIEKLDGELTSAHLAMATLDKLTANEEKITLQLTDVENGTVTDGSYHILHVADGAVSLLDNTLDLTAYGYNAEGKYDATLDTVQRDYMQNLLQQNKYVEFSTTKPDGLMLLAQGTPQNLYMSITQLDAKLSIWNLDGQHTMTEAGLTVLDGNGKLVSNTILDNVQSVVVTDSQTLDLTGSISTVKLNGLTAQDEIADVAEQLTITGDSAEVDSATITTAKDGYKGEITLVDVAVAINGKVDTLSLLDAEAELTGAATQLSMDDNSKATLNDATGTNITLDGDNVTVNGTMSGGSLNFGIASTELGADVAAGNLVMTGSDINVTQTDTATVISGVGSGTTTIARLGGMSGDVTVKLTGAGYDKYFANARLEGSAVVADRNASYYTDGADAAMSDNGKAGMGMADAVLVYLNPQADKKPGALAGVLDVLDATSADKADELGASLAGAATAVLGMAVAGDVDRQLQAIRNRTTTMGVDQSVANEDMPYFNAWINAEGDRAELNHSGTEGGYELNSWGGTVGFDVDICPTFTAGMAMTAMYGDLDVTGADKATGDLDTYYLSAFARYAASAWTHTFVATVGMSDISLDRTVNGNELEGETDGLSFGLMYEVGRVIALDEDATACLQPVFNVTWKHTTVDGYTEKGSDLALEVDDQTMDTVTFGLGTRLQAVVGESMYNRTSILEARVLAKADVGDRRGSSDVALSALEQAKGSTDSAEMGAFGLEAGAGLTVPLGQDGGSIFMDASVELRSDYTNVNGTVGYRMNF